jgi:hypothetical protein
MSSSTDEPRLFAWDTHAGVCARCRRVLLSQPATFGQTCLEGAKLLKAALTDMHGGRGRRERWQGRAP